jgi:hypothetical protein
MQESAFAVCTAPMSPARIELNIRLELAWPYSFQSAWKICTARSAGGFHTCPYIPVRVVEEYNQLKESDKTRGNTQYWVLSAEQLGLVNMVDDRTIGICFTAPYS